MALHGHTPKQKLSIRNAGHRVKKSAAPKKKAAKKSPLTIKR